MQFAKRAMELHEMLHGQRFGSLKNLARAIIAIAHLQLLRVRHGHDSQSENLVDLCAIE